MKNELKTLQTRIAKLASQLSTVNTDISLLQSHKNNIKDKIDKIKYDIEMLTDKDIQISEHAILRYLERVCLIDLDKIKNEILDDKTKTLIRKLGNGKYPINNGFKIVVKNNVVLTVIN